MSGMQCYRDILEPFTRNRKSTADERATILELWSDVVRRLVSRRFVFFDVTAASPSPSAGTPDILLAKSVRPPTAGALHHDKLTVLLQFLRFVTLRKVIDHVLEPSCPALLSSARKRHVLCSMLYAAAEVSSLLPTEDLRIGGVRRGIPWGSLGESFSSSDEDRDDGTPRPIEALFATVSALLVAHWHIICPVHWHGVASPMPIHSDDDEMPSRWSSRPTSPRSSANGSGEQTPSTSPSSPEQQHATFQDMATFAECVKMLLLRNLWFHQEGSLGATLSLSLCLTRSLVLWNIGTNAPTVPVRSDAATLELFYAPEVKVMMARIDFFAETLATKIDCSHLQSWAPRLQFSAGVRALHTSLLVRGMYGGAYQHRVSALSGFVRPSSDRSVQAIDALELDMSVTARAPRVCTLQVIMEAFEWYLASGESECAARYLHTFPSHYKDDNGYDTTSTEANIVHTATILSAEAKRRCVLLCEEFHERRNLELESFTGSTSSFPHKPAVIPDGVPLDGPHALRYGQRKKISEMLRSMCPDRYPIRECIILPDDVPEVQLIEMARNRQALIETELLRVARLEAHERLEWLRVEDHNAAKLRVGWNANIDAIHEAYRADLVEVELHHRRQIDWCSQDIWLRARIEHAADCGLRDIAASAKVEKMRVKVREREAADYRRVSGLVAYLEATSRAEVESEEAAARHDTLRQQELTLRRSIAAERDTELSASLHLQWVDVQANVSVLRMHQREAAERNLMVRWMVSSLSRSLQRLRPATSPQHGSTLRAYVETFLNPMLSALCGHAQTPLTIGGVWCWYQSRLNEAALFIAKEATERAEICAAVQAFQYRVPTMLVPQLHLDVHVSREVHSRRVLALTEAVERAALDEACGRLHLIAREDMDFACRTSEPTAAFDAIVLFESLCSRLRALVDSTEPNRAASLAATESLCWSRLMSESNKSRRDIYKRQRPSEAAYIGPERGLAPRPPSAVCAPTMLRAAPPVLAATAATDRNCATPPLVPAQFAESEWAHRKSPASSRGGVSATPGLSTARDVMSALSSRSADLDTSTVTFVLDLDGMMPTSRASSGFDPRHGHGHAAPSCFTPQPPAVLAVQHGQRRVSLNTTTASLLSSNSYRDVIDVPRRPTSAKPRAYTHTNRASVEPTSRSPLRYRADETDSIALIHQILSGAAPQFKHH